MPKKEDGVNPLKFLEKSHNISIIMALYKNGMMNRNQLYDELGETINVVIKRINQLIENDLIYEKEMKVKPFTKGIALTTKGREVANELEKIKKILSKDIPNKSWRVNYPFKIDEELMLQVHPGDPEYYRVFIEDLSCNNCGADTFLMKDKDKFAWVCFKCGSKKDADIEDAKRLLLWEM